MRQDTLYSLSRRTPRNLDLAPPLRFARSIRRGGPSQPAEDSRSVLSWAVKALAAVAMAQFTLLAFVACDSSSFATKSGSSSPSPARSVAARPTLGASTAPRGSGGTAPGTEGAVPFEALGLWGPPHDGGPEFTLPMASWSAVTDRFGAPRARGLVHGGIDLAVPADHHSPVLSACRGRVKAPDTSASYGLYVLVDCGAGWETLYAHLSFVTVAEGDAVAAGGILGGTGVSGLSTGEHLHFEIRFNGSALNPEDFLDFGIRPGQPLTSDVPEVSRTRADATPDAGAATPAATATSTPVPTPTLSPTPTRTPTLTPTPPRPTATATATARPPFR